jgi:subtilase family serine protease
MVVDEGGSLVPFRVLLAILTVAIIASISGDHLADSRARVLLPVRQEIREAEMIGRVEEESSFDLVLSLKMRNREELDQFVSSLHDPNSPNFQQWLSPEQFGERFGVSEDDYLQMTRWLEENGFEVTAEWPSRSQINFRGTTKQIRSAFRTQLNRYRVKDEIHFANSSSPVLPAQFDNLVEHISGLEDFSLPQPSIQLRQKDVIGRNFRSGRTTAMAPKDLQRVYNLESLIGSGSDGSNQKIGIVARSNFKKKDIKIFRSEFGLPPNSTKKLFPFGPVRNRGGTEEIEVVFDTEWAGVAAPGASIVVAIAPDIMQSLQFFVNRMPDIKIISMSFRECEPSLGANVRVYHNIYTQAVAQGQTVFVAAGNTGADDCGTGRGRQVNGLASSPNCVAVGGTTVDPDFDENGDARGLREETGWTSSGGGISTIHAKPPYQQGVPGVPEEDRRSMPDVAQLADDMGPGAWIGYQGGITCCIGGTSLATPIWASFLALVNQKIGPQGNFNFKIYSMGMAQSSKRIPAVFNDTVKGNNSFKGVVGFDAAPGYDQVTGWGSFNGQVFIDNLK